MDNLNRIAKTLVFEGKGILAADESTGTMTKRLATINVESTPESRRSYREILFTTAGVEEFISGVILYDETIRQSDSDGTLFPKLLASRGIIPGIKVDKGTTAISNSLDETVTQGLDGLLDRLKEYYKLGARFTKWRAVIRIGEGFPTDKCILANAKALASFAKLSQEQGMVPIVEPEVLMDGSHNMARCEEVTGQTLKVVFEELKKQNVDLTGILLKPNMILPGLESGEKVTPAEIAEATLRILHKFVPSDVPGIVFLSGGQSDVEATVNLNEMNKTKNLPWQLSFSYGRALQASVLASWGGKPENVEAAKKAFYHRAKMNSLARFGKYSKEMETKS